MSGNKIHIRQIMSSTQSISSSTDPNGVKNVTLDLYLDPENFTQVGYLVPFFEYFKFNYVVFKFIPTQTVNVAFNQTVGGQAVTTNIPTLHWIKDWDDAHDVDSIMPDTIQKWMCRPSYREKRMDQIITIKCKPSMLNPVFLISRGQQSSDPQAMTSKPVWKQWIDTTAMGTESVTPIQYYGVRAAISWPSPMTGQGTYWNYRLEVKGYFSFKGLRAVGDLT